MRLLPAVILGLSACLGVDDDPGIPECGRDDECPGECARTGTCEAAGTTVTVRITWTIDGTAPSIDEPSPCAGIASLTVNFGRPDDPEQLAYRPVTCSLGQITYDRIPPRLEVVSIAVLGEDGAVVDRVSRPLSALGSDGALPFDLRGAGTAN